MKSHLLVFIFFLTTSCSTGKVSFINKVDIRQATKDGIYMNGYVVNIGYEKARELDGKTIRVTGKVTIVNGVQNTDGEMSQGRTGDTKHILHPRIKVISD